MSGKALSAVCLAALAFMCTSSVSAAMVTFNNFADVSSLTLNGSAAQAFTGDGAVLRLTPALPGQSGSAFGTTTLNATTFSTYFRFRITDPGGTLFDGNTDPGADGLVFVVQSVSASIGGAGAGIGYAGINPSIGVEFDTWHNSANNDPDSNHLGIDVNGSVYHTTHAHTLPVATRFDDGNIWHAWIDYDGTTLEVRTNQTGIRPGASMLSRTLDIPTLLGVSNAYVGFTSGTGADWGNHDILAWEYRDSYAPIPSVPEPGALAAWVSLALTAAVGIYRRRRTVAA